MAYSGEFETGWGKGELLCGPGSLEKFAKPSREKLRHWLSVTEAKSILEIGCGDLVWHGKILPKVDYHGVDLHERETWKARREQGAKLAVADGISTDLPKADLIVARDVFIHLSNDYIARILENLKGKGTWLFASHDPNAKATREGRGQATFNKHDYGVNLNADPFYLEYHEEQDPPKGKGMCLFKL